MISLKELRKYRFLSLSAIDFFGTLIIVIIILSLLKKLNMKNFIIFSIVAIILGIVTHDIFKVNTRLNYLLGISQPPDV